MTCIDAFKNLNIVMQSNVLEISPCCISPSKAVTTVDFINNTYLNQVRQDWQNDVYPIACSACKQAENSNLNSRRIGSNQWYSDHDLFNTDVELTRIDYWVGDLCNLKCVICGPENSSSWKQELNLPIEVKRMVNNQFWKTMDLSSVKFIHFTGGEPLLSKEHVELLKSLPDKSQVHLNYNTNATILPSAELLDLWSKFNLVQLDFSIDDIGARFEYQRFPANWDKVVENLQWYIDNTPTNCMFSVNTSVGVLNQHNIDNLKSWLSDNFSTNRVTDPIEHRQQMVVGLLSINTMQQRWLEIVKFLDICDQKRGTDWRKTFPELVKTYKYN